jgi:hypothetical protein
LISIFMVDGWLHMADGWAVDGSWWTDIDH